MKIALGKERVLAIGDLHVPFHHKDSYRFLRAIKAKYKPTKVVCLGDEIDAHALSDYTSDPDGMSAGDELIASIKGLKELYKMFPNVDICESNHTARPFRRAYKFGIPKAFLKDYKDFLQAPKGWNWYQEITVDGINYEHGTGFSGPTGATKCAVATRRSSVIGHIHSFAGIQFIANNESLIFGFNVGCLIDKDRYAFAYSKSLKSKPILGVGLIDKGIPTFIPMVLNDKGRWIGKLM